ncbi:alpha/beta hydrolase [Paraburkholderia sp. DHOC27]|uniref:alpha/beta hydrolase n=1 Tax=Paraburkholderia sp. DHOC27 TaxID=2303330 RepID=UPI0015F30BC7|nr:alpha/beta hydrolase [Paraburkholderia sp. DHOC27]
MFLEAYRVASENTRQTQRSMLDVSYGMTKDECMDLFFPQCPGPHPLHMFVHGGYWRAFSRKDYSFVADSILDAGAVAAIVDYAHLPVARMGTLVEQVRKAAHWLVTHAESLGGKPDCVSASGHSAGAHLASYLVARGPLDAVTRLVPVQSLLLVSGIYDLRCVAESFLQPELQLTCDEISNWSPLNADFPTDNPPLLVVGERETAPFHTQARQMNPTRYVSISDENHMSIVMALGTPGTRMAGLLRDCVRGCRANS